MKSNKDNFQIAQIAFCYLCVINVFGLLLMLLEANYSAIDMSLMQKISVVATVIANASLMALGFFFLAISLERCTKVIWRIAVLVLSVAVIANVLATLAQPAIMPLLNTIVSISGIASLLYDRKVVFGKSESDTSGVVHG
ncbi:hypothetical protein [Pandoraea sp. NPDC090278]|uniref:hypothetical protein n=1 Tax=Pandoraea sp. NPDC090278 TaxID=3364391 RepID=UPI003839F6F0